jgi:hypothetical protein
VAGEVSAFGVTAAVVAQYVGGTAFGTNTIPTQATVEAMIARVSAQWSGMIERRGVDVSGVAAEPTSQLYLMSQEWIARRCALDAIVARERTFPPSAEFYRDQCQAIWGEVQQRTAALLDGQPTQAGAPGLIDSHVQRSEQIRRRLEDGPLAQRLAWGSKL